LAAAIFKAFAATGFALYFDIIESGQGMDRIRIKGRNFDSVGG